ncbi:Major facilitator superfamily transporter [Pleurostoma richardsiae]|uniref:Major facilitator superfamily transporter n=1 Tax=Pleurostoma richardsiae TaxID=41990 RepID=A0AA38RQP9_9PEZI|nr:Major facilitator superfamily transporter [Pleurostoma richardsiae]
MSSVEKEDELVAPVDSADVTRQLTQDLFREASLPAWRFAVLSVGLCLGLFLSMLDASIVATSLFTIGTEFDALDKVNWVALAYTLSFLSCAVFLARMTDIIGRRNAFLAAFFIFFAFSLGCGFSNNLSSLIACRALQGIGGSGLFSITMIIFPELSPDRLKHLIASIVGLVIGLAGILGPILGGVLTHLTSWRWIFWINAPIGFLSMVLFYLTWPKAEYLPAIEKRSWKDLDFVGSFLVIVSAVLVVFSFQNAGNEDAPWGRAIFLAPLIIGVLSWITLFTWEAFFERRWKDKMAAFPLGLLRNHVYAFALLNTMFQGFPFMTTIYALPLRIQVVNEKSPLTAGLLLLPMLVTVAVGSSIGGVVTGKTKRICETLVVATILVTIGCALETTVSGTSKIEPKTTGFLALIGLGFGLSVSSSTTLTVLEAPIHEHAPAQGILAQVRILGGSLGIAASSAILGVRQRADLAGEVPLSALQGDQHGLSPEQLRLVRATYNDVFTETMKVCAVVAGIGILFALGTFRHNRLTPEEQRKAQVRAEVERRKAHRVPAEVASTGTSA